MYRYLDEKEGEKQQYIWNWRFNHKTVADFFSLYPDLFSLFRIIRMERWVLDSLMEIFNLENSVCSPRSLKCFVTFITKSQMITSLILTT